MDDYSPDEMLAIYEDIKKRIDARFAMRTRFLGNMAGFVATLFVIFLRDAGPLAYGSQTLDRILPGVMGFWLIVLCIHAAFWLMFELRERAIRREIEQAGFGIYNQYPIAAKRKRYNDAAPERLVQPSDDGEIVNLYADDSEYEMYADRS